MLKIAFKEWAAVCAALANGTQSIIVRKGGIAEVGGEFRPEHTRFWLYPTYYHERHRWGLKPEAMPLLEEAEQTPRTSGEVVLSHIAEVVEIFHIDDLAPALALDDCHIWSPENIEKRFHYRTPGLYVMAVRVIAAIPVTIRERPEYEGCKTWVELDRELPDTGSPVLSESEFQSRLTTIRQRLSARH